MLPTKDEIMQRIMNLLEKEEIYDLITELTRNEGNALTLFHPNDDFAGASQIIELVCNFNHEQPQTYYGSSLLECLKDAKAGMLEQQKYDACVHLWDEPTVKTTGLNGTVTCIKCGKIEPRETVVERMMMDSWGPSA